jgi:Carboxypeptidase regulatory-like domain
MKSLVAAVIVAVLLTACNTDSLPPAAGFTTVSGTIVDGATHNPVAGAVVTIDTVLTGTTDAGGKFSVDKVPAGIVDYTVQAKGYKLVSSSVTIEPGKPFELDLTLGSASTP